jgi:hypothetical protein
MNWETMSPTERNALIAGKIMSGKPATYTTDLTAAFSVVDAMAERGCNVSVFRGPVGRSCSMWTADRPVQTVKESADTVPEAICWAAVSYIDKYQ